MRVALDYELGGRRRGCHAMGERGYVLCQHPGKASVRSIYQCLEAGRITVVGPAPISIASPEGAIVCQWYFMEIFSRYSFSRMYDPNIH